MSKDRDYSDDSFDESDQYSDQGFDIQDIVDTMADDSTHRGRKRKGKVSSRQRIEDLHEAKWLRTHLQDWVDWDDDPPAF